MKPADFHYALPPELIAQRPLPERSASRLLHVPGGSDAFRELTFSSVGELLRPGDLLVLNDTRVLKARLYGHKATGGRVELLLERILAPRLARVQLRSSRSPAPGSRLHFGDGVEAEVEGRDGGFFQLRFDRDVVTVLEQSGHMPLPPYIERADDADDAERYQTVFSRRPGAVAAPTAGLHFDRTLLESLEAAGIESARITLHVGAGTFMPLREEQLSSGRLHEERAEVGAEVCAQIRAARARGGRVIAVGTTVVRALEAAAAGGEIAPFDGETDLFITPGYRFRVIDAMITNFHLPESSLLMLVCAFRGRETVLAAYRHAVEQRFRFFSFGDAMFVERAE